ncbi:murein transglycosylase A [Hydrogenophaga sp. RWCD_12]|uniref:murein transglycosylase A n=1 Tax=Hydrogenophaga sp. RWCD_12 TaxID=3391190 RepID=UPI0039849E57
MVHHTMKISNTSAASASSISRSMGVAWNGWGRWTAALIVGSLAACTTVEVPQTPPGPVADNDPLPPAIQRATARWVPVRWSEVPGWGTDQLHEVWSAWVRGCEKPAAGQAALCAELRPLTMADAGEQRAWIERRFRPYRVTDTEGRPPPGLLTGYYEPVLNASRLPTATQRVPLYGVPPGLRAGQPWYSRQDIDTLPAAQTALKDRAIAWLADPIDALVLQIQGSGRINLREADGSIKTVRLTFAGHNGHPYQSVGKWLLDQGDSRGSGWEGIRAWAAQNPKRLNEMLWSNPRTVFFKEVPLNALDAKFGPSGAQGVALTPGRSIAVDPQSVPYGTPVWIATQGPALNQQKLVMAQDTGGAITGAVRADLFTGWGSWSEPAYQLASRLKQPLQMWVLWPR